GPPLTIPNREVKPVCADGTATSGGRVGRRLFLKAPAVLYGRCFFFFPISGYAGRTGRWGAQGRGTLQSGISSNWYISRSAHLHIARSNHCYIAALDNCYIITLVHFQIGPSSNRQIIKFPNRYIEI